MHQPIFQFALLLKSQAQLFEKQIIHEFSIFLPQKNGEISVYEGAFFG